MRRVLVTGMSGTGKSAALAELEARGFRVVDTDRPGWSEWIDGDGDPDGGGWYWREPQMAELLATEDERTLYVSGTVTNQGSFTTGSMRSSSSAHPPR
jgi:predicted ATPase